MGSKSAEGIAAKAAKVAKELGKKAAAANA